MSLHSEQDRHSQTLAAEQASLSKLKVELGAAQQEQQQARDALVAAHADATPSAIKAAEKQRAAIDAKLEDLAIRTEAAELRVQRAAKARWEFEVENARGLIKEMEADAIGVAERMTAHVEALVAEHGKWHGINQEVGRLLALNPATAPRGNALDDHPYAPVVRDLRRALSDHGPVPPPLPHMERYEFERRQEEDAVKAKADRRAREERERRQREANGVTHQ